MLNKVILMGRLTRDPEIKQTQNGKTMLKFTVAVDRGSGDAKQTDFISCVAWEKRAEFIAKYFGKGSSIVILGNLRTRTYDDKNGTKHYVTEVYVDEAQFTFEPKAAQESPQTAYIPQGASYMPDPPASPQRGTQTANYNDYNIFSDGGTPF